MRNTIRYALPIVAAAYGRRFGVQVQVGGTRATTDGQAIRIPAIDETPIARTLAWGYLTHEAAHLRFTDFAVWDRAVTRGPLVKMLLNIIEDVRVERAIIRLYPGTKRTLDAVNTWLADAGLMRPPAASESPPRVLGSALLVMLMYRVRRQQDFQALAAESEIVLRRVFPQRFMHRLLTMLKEVPRLDSTRAAADLAERIVALIGQEAATPPTPGPAPQPTPASAEDAGDGQPDGEQDDPREAQGPDGSDDQDNRGGSGNGDPEVDAQDAASDGAGQGHDPDETGRDQPADPGGDAGTGEPASGQQDRDGGGDAGKRDGDDGTEVGNAVDAAGEDGRSALQAVLAAGVNDLPGDPFRHVAAALAGHATGQRTTLLPAVEDYQGDLLAGQVMLMRARFESAKLTLHLQALVEAHQLTKPQTVRRGRVLNPTALHRVAVGDDRVFARTHQRIAPNTAIHLLVDLSGSMAKAVLGPSGPRRRYQIALDAAMALTLALEPLRGVSCAVTAFPGLAGCADTVTRILAPGERVSARVGAFVQGARGNTPMTGALWFAAADLLARPEPRKVLLVMTDGDPDDRDSTVAMVRRATGAGIELLGVGIAKPIAQLFPMAIFIEDVAHLKDRLFGIAEQLLLS